MIKSARSYWILEDNSYKLGVDLDLLRSQYEWLLKQDQCEEREGLLNMIECMLSGEDVD